MTTANSKETGSTDNSYLPCYCGGEHRPWNCSKTDKWPARTLAEEKRRQELRKEKGDVSVLTGNAWVSKFPGAGRGVPTAAAQGSSLRKKVTVSFSGDDKGNTAKMVRPGKNRPNTDPSSTN